MKMNKENNYPVVLMAGFLAFGEDEWLSKFLPYFGWWKTDIRKLFKVMGVECYTPSSGPFSSAWDKACETYAAIMGKTVDYGKAHSEKYGHERFGRSYDTPLFPDWGQLDESGKIKKLNLIGWSFGAPSERILTTLLAYGSVEERAVTPESELSDLFKGGHDNWVHSIISLSGVNNGTSLLYALDSLKVASPAIFGVYCLGSFLSNTPFSKIYDYRLDHFGLTVKPKLTNTGFNINTKAARKVIESEDNMFYDMTPHGSIEINEETKMCDKIYYYSQAACDTKNISGFSLPSKSSLKFPVLMPITSLIMGLYNSNRSDGKRIPVSRAKWGASDGMVNVDSSMYPKGDPFTFVHPFDKTEPGIWNVLPTENNKT
ncbi:MAG: hypothetical protein LBH71_03745, partial [Oscillospiraceae bacterium]|nr:hypothetical protein [Oscillospiraceae bacterium]